MTHSRPEGLPLGHQWRSRTPVALLVASLAASLAALCGSLAGCSTLPENSREDRRPPAATEAPSDTSRNNGDNAPRDLLPAPPPAPNGTAALPLLAPGADGVEVVLTALSLVGAPYRFGGEDPASGVDCSGLVRHAFRTSVSLELPRSSEQMAAQGTSVAAEELRAGDLVFFNTLGRHHSHVGIYIGDRQFVHAPTARGTVRIDLLDAAYWRTRFDGARRILTVATTAAAATARARTERSTEGSTESTASPH